MRLLNVWYISHVIKFLIHNFHKHIMLYGDMLYNYYMAEDRSLRKWTKIVTLVLWTEMYISATKRLWGHSMAHLRYNTVKFFTLYISGIEYKLPTLNAKNYHISMHKCACSLVIQSSHSLGFQRFILCLMCRLIWIITHTIYLHYIN